MTIHEGETCTCWVLTATGTHDDPNRRMVGDLFPHTYHLENEGPDDDTLPIGDYRTVSGTRIRAKTPTGYSSFDYIVDTEGVRLSQDVTGQPSPNITPAPNLTCEYVVADDTVFALIDADSDHLVLWNDEFPEEPV